MKNFIFLALGTMLSFSSKAQTMDTAAKKTDFIAQKVIGFFKTKQPDSIYRMTNLSFRNKLTPENFNAIALNQIIPLNNFEKVTYVSSMQGINKYKVNGTPDLQLMVGLDAEGKIETLLIQPFME